MCIRWLGSDTPLCNSQTSKAMRVSSLPMRLRGHGDRCAGREAVGNLCVSFLLDRSAALHPECCPS